MSNDHTLRELLSQKMAEVEAPVDPSIWNAIGSQLPAASGVSASAGALTISSKLVWAAAVVGAALLTSIAIVLSSDEEHGPVDEAAGTIPHSAEGANPQEEEEQASPFESEVIDDYSPTQPETQEKPSGQKRQLTVVADHDDPIVDSIEYETIYERTPTEVVAKESERTSDVPSPNHTEQDEEITPTVPSPSLQPAPGLSAQFIITESAFEGLSYYFNPTYIEGDRYVWFFGDGSSSDLVSPEHEFDAPGNYLVSLDVFDKNGFSTHFERAIEAYLPAKLVLPNTFSPNGDGHNDLLNISVESRGVMVVKMLIYSPEGILIYEQSGEGPGWDGAHPNGDACATGNYLMIVRATSEGGEVFNEQKTVRLQR